MHDQLNSSGLKAHIKSIHEGLKKNHKCDLCDKAFSNIGHLKVHINSFHYGIRNYKCHLCYKAFSENGKLKRHLLTVQHSDKKANCGVKVPEILKDPVVLKMPMPILFHDERSRDPKCNLCYKYFNSMEDVKKHFSTVHIRCDLPLRPN